MLLSTSRVRLLGCSVGVTLCLAGGSLFAQPFPQSPGPAPAASNPALDTQRLQAEAAYQRQDFQKGIEITDAMLRTDPSSHEAYYLRGSCRVELGLQRRDGKLIRSGIEDAREALRLGGTSQINYYLPYMYGMTGLASLENKKEHAETTIKIADGVLARPNLNPQEKANIYYQRASAKAFAGKVPEAVADYQAAIKADNQHLGSHVALAETLAMSGKWAEAEAAFSAAVAAFPGNPLVYNNRGMFFQQRNRLQDALTDFAKSIQLDPKFYVGYTNRGFAQLTEGNAKAAEADFNESLKLNPQQPLLYSLRGGARLAQGRTQDALNDYSTVAQQEPRNPVARADVAFTRFFGKDYAGALQTFEQAEQLDPSMRYLAPWKMLCGLLGNRKEVATNLAAESVAKAVDKRDWIDSLIIFLDGRMNETELQNATDRTDPILRNIQLCEAYFFIGQKRLLAGDGAGAGQFFQKALDTKARHLSAYRGSQFALGKFAQ